MSRGNRNRKGSRGQKPFTRPWKKLKKPPPTELIDEVQPNTPETEAEPPQPTPEEPIEEKPSQRLASLLWAENFVHIFRGDPRCLLNSLEIYVMYNHQRISPEAIDFFQKELGWRSGRTTRKEAQPLRPFWRTKETEPITRSA